MALSEKTRINLSMGTALTALVASVPIFWGGAFTLIRLKMIEENQYTKAAAVEQALRMAIENPGMSVPDPRDPAKMILVEGAVVRPFGAPYKDPQ